MNPLFKKHIKSIRTKQNISKYWEFGELNNNIIIHFFETRLQSTIGTIIKVQMAWLTDWQVIWYFFLIRGSAEE